MPDITIECPECGAEIEVNASDLDGNSMIVCPHCGREIDPDEVEI